MHKNIKIAILLFLFFTQFVYSESIIYENKDVSAFSLENFEGNKFKLIDYLGKTRIYLSFYASWCIPCREEIKLINKLAPKYEHQLYFINLDGSWNPLFSLQLSEIYFFLISIDAEGDTDLAKKMTDSLHRSIIVLHDKDQRIARLYDATNIPKSVLVTKSKKCYKILTGFKSGEEDEINTAILNLIKE